MPDIDLVKLREIIADFVGHFGIEHPQMKWEVIEYVDFHHQPAVMVAHKGSVIFHGDPNHQEPNDVEPFKKIVALAIAAPTVEALFDRLERAEKERDELRLRVFMADDAGWKLKERATTAEAALAETEDELNRLVVLHNNLSDRYAKAVAAPAATWEAAAKIVASFKQVDVSFGRVLIDRAEAAKAIRARSTAEEKANE